MYKEKLRIPRIEVKVEDRPLATITTIDWEALLEVLSQGRVPKLKKVIVKGEKITTFSDILKVRRMMDKRLPLARYYTSRRSIIIYIDRLVVESLFGHISFGSLIEEDIELSTLTVLGHEVEHALQQPYISREGLIKWFGLSGVIASGLSIAAGEAVNTQLLSMAFYLSQFGAGSSFLLSRMVTNFFIPYSKRPHEQKAFQAEERLEEEYNRGQGQRLIEVDIDYARIKAALER